jgi:chromosome segregation ATPase
MQRLTAEILHRQNAFRELDRQIQAIEAEIDHTEREVEQLEKNTPAPTEPASTRHILACRAKLTKLSWKMHQGKELIREARFIVMELERLLTRLDQVQQEKDEEILKAVDIAISI